MEKTTFDFLTHGLQYEVYSFATLLQYESIQLWRYNTHAISEKQVWIHKNAPELHSDDDDDEKIKRRYHGGAGGGFSATNTHFAATAACFFFLGLALAL